MGKLENNFSTHHILPRSKWWASVSENLEYIKNSKHRAIHTLFENKMIADQLITTIWLSARALREDVRDWLLETLSSRDMDDPYEWYKDICIQ